MLVTHCHIDIVLDQARAISTGPLDQAARKLPSTTESCPGRPAASSRIPGLIVERLQVTHPADDDNVYFIGDEDGLDRIQLDTFPDGQPSFYIENGGRHQTSEVAEAASIIGSYLKQGRPPETTT